MFLTMMKTKRPITTVCSNTIQTSPRTRIYFIVMAEPFFNTNGNVAGGKYKSQSIFLLKMGLRNTVGVFGHKPKTVFIDFHTNRQLWGNYSTEYNINRHFFLTYHLCRVPNNIILNIKHLYWKKVWKMLRATQIQFFMALICASSMCSLIFAKDIEYSRHVNRRGRNNLRQRQLDEVCSCTN